MVTVSVIRLVLVRVVVALLANGIAWAAVRWGIDFGIDTIQQQQIAEHVVNVIFWFSSVLMTIYPLHKSINEWLTRRNLPPIPLPLVTAQDVTSLSGIEKYRGINDVRGR